MNFLPARRRRSAVFDLTPMIDVTLQLIIFFMFTSQFTQAPQSSVDLPRQPGERQAPAPAMPLFIEVDRAGAYSIDGQTMGLERLSQRLNRAFRQADPANPIDLVVRADQNAPAAAVNALAERLMLMGRRSWRLATRTDAGGPP